MHPQLVGQRGANHLTGDMNGAHGTSSSEDEDFEEAPPPLPPKRTTSLVKARRAEGHGNTVGNGIGTRPQIFPYGGSSTMTLKYQGKSRECSAPNPKRISIATSTLLEGQHGLSSFYDGWDNEHGSLKASSVWNPSEKGSSECIDIWGDPPAVKKGVLLQQREKLWSRWKERYCILTRDYLHCFRRTTSIHKSGVRLSEMGSFIFKLRLAEVEEIEWENRKSGSIIALMLPQQSRILFKLHNDNEESLRQWFTLLQECIYMSKERRQALRNLYNPSTYRTISSNKSQDSRESSSANSTSNSSSDKSSVLNGGFPVHETSMRKNFQRMSIAGTPSVLRRYYPLLSDPGADDDEGMPRGPRRLSSGDYDDLDQLLDSQKKLVYQRNARTASSDVVRKNVSNGNGGKKGGGVDGRDFSKTDYSIPFDSIRTRKSISGPYSTSNSQNMNDNVNNINNNNYLNGYNFNGSVCGGRGTGGMLNKGLLQHDYGGHRGSSKRPESWSATQPNLFYRTPSLVPSQWSALANHRRDFAHGGGSGSRTGTAFSRGSMVYCPGVCGDMVIR